MSDSRRPAELGLGSDTETFYSGAFVSRAFRTLAELRELWLVSDTFNRIHVSLAVHELLASQTLREDPEIFATARKVLAHGLTKELYGQFLLSIISHRKDPGL